MYRAIKKHPKLRKLAKLMGVSKAEAIGLLYVVWDYCQDDADADGTLVEVEREDIEEELVPFTDLAPEEVVDAMFSTGWLELRDERVAIHNWDVWQSEWHRAKERRMKDVERKRKERETAEKKPASPEPDGELKDTPQKSVYTKDFEAFCGLLPFS